MASNPDVTILLTRPEAQSHRFAAGLSEALAPGFCVILSPLLRIEPLDVVLDLRGVGHLLLTSLNGVRAATRLTVARDLPVSCVGKKTALAARKAGFSVRVVAPDSARLIAQLRARGPVARPYLYLRGQRVAHPIAALLGRAGITAREQVVYAQHDLPLNDAARRVLDGKNRVILPLFSPRTAQVFSTEARDLDLQQTTAVCLSAKVARKLDQGRFFRVLVAQHPDAAALQQEIAAII